MHISLYIYIYISSPFRPDMYIYIYIYTYIYTIKHIRSERRSWRYEGKVSFLSHISDFFLQLRHVIIIYITLQ